MSWLEIAAALALALTLGGMTFFSAVIAPLVFIKLPGETAAGFIRQLFPWYYLVMGLTAAVASLLLLAVGAGWSLGIVVIVTLGFAFARQVLMPTINRHRDAEMAGDSDAAVKFARLHRFSVWLNGAQWLGVIGAFILLLSR